MAILVIVDHAMLALAKTLALWFEHVRRDHVEAKGRLRQEQDDFALSPLSEE